MQKQIVSEPSLTQAAPTPNPSFRWVLPSAPEATSSPSYLTSFLLLLAVYCAWVFSLPMFPTQDDSMHLYYVHVLHHLLNGDSLFAHFYSLRHPLPPYTVQYAVLFALTNLMNPTVAEKLMVCIILASTALGFRFFATAIGRNGRLLSLWIFPIALSWPLFMGFHNFCLSVSFVLWSLGLWIRAGQTRRLALRIAFLLSVTIVALTHPVPLLFLLGAVGADVVTRIVAARYGSGYSWRTALLRQRVNFYWAASAYMSLGYISLFLNKHTHEPAQAPGHRLNDLLVLLRMEHISFASGGLWTKLHRLGLLAILGLSFVLAAQAWRKCWSVRKINSSAIILLSAAAVFLALPLMPSRMNGLEYFADRLPIFAWIFALAAASAALPSQRLQRISWIGSCVFAIFTVLLANTLVRPIATEISQINSFSPSQPQAQPPLGLIFDAPIKIEPASLSFNPFFRWSGARYVQRNGALLLDDPWAGAPNILPVDRLANKTADFSQHDFQYPEHIYKQLLDSPQKRDHLLSQVDFVLFVGLPAPGIVEPLLAADSARHWACTQSSWYFVCTPSAATTTSPRVLLGPSSPESRNANKVLYVRDRIPRSTSEATPFTYSRMN